VVEAAPRSPSPKGTELVRRGAGTGCPVALSIVAPMEEVATEGAAEAAAAVANPLVLLLGSVLLLLLMLAGTVGVVV